MDCIKIDAHVHLWEKQDGLINGKRVYGVGGGRSDFCGEIRQMMPATLIHVAFSPQTRTAQTNDTAKPMRHSPKYTAALPFPSVSMPK